MKKPNGHFVYILKWVCVWLFFAVLSFPLTLMILNGPEKPNETLAESVVELQPFSVRAYVTGTFHENFDAWFSKHFSYRNEMVSLHRNILYRWEMSKLSIAVQDLLLLPDKNDLPKPPLYSDDDAQTDPTDHTPKDPEAIYTDPDNIYAEVNRLQLAQQPVEPVGFKGSDGILVGRSGYLFQDAYIDEYYGFTSDYTSITKEGIDQTVRQLEYIQEELWDRYDITMVYVISPNKVSMYDEYVSQYYLRRYPPNEGYVRPVDMLRDSLQDSEVIYLDSVEHYKKIGLLNTFTKTGTHWNHLASFETTAEIIRLYEKYGSKSVKTMDSIRVFSQKDPVSDGSNTSDDADIYHILYDALGDVPGKIMDDAYYYSEVALKNTKAAPISILLQGGSFATDIDYYLRKYDIGEVRYIHYNGIRHRNTWEGEDPWSRGIMIWESILADLDLIIFEVNENYIRSKHCSGNDWQGECGDHTIGSNATYDSLYAFLKATE